MSLICFTGPIQIRYAALGHRCPFNASDTYQPRQSAQVLNPFSVRGCTLANSITADPVKLNLGGVNQKATLDPTGATLVEPKPDVERKISAKISDDSSGGRFYVAGLVSFITVEESPGDPHVPHPPTHLPGRGVKVTPKASVDQPFDGSDGSRPVVVAQGGYVRVAVGFKIEGSPPTGEYSATLVISDEESTPISVSVPVSVEVTDLLLGATFSNQSLSVKQGKSVSVSFPVSLAANPGTAATAEVAYDLGDDPPPGVTLSPNSIRVAARSTVQATLTFNAMVGADPGMRQITVSFDTDAFGGKSRFFAGQVALRIDPGDMFVTPARQGPLVVKQGDKGNVPVQIDLDGGPTEVSFTQAPTGLGLSISPASFPLPASAQQVEQLTYAIDSRAIVFEQLPIAVNWTAYRGLTSGTLSLPFTVQSVTRTFKKDLVKDGDVECQNPTLVCSSEGGWQFSARVFDEGILFGDKYAVSFGFSFIDPSGATMQPVVLKGVLGGKTFGPQRSAIIGTSGKSDWLARNWQAVFALQDPLVVQVKATSNPSQPWTDLTDALGKFFANLLKGLSGGAVAQEDSAGEGRPPGFSIFPPAGGSGEKEGGEESV
jgi:hypothetical protein